MSDGVLRALTLISALGCGLRHPDHFLVAKLARTQRRFAARRQPALPFRHDSGDDLRVSCSCSWRIGDDA